MKTEIKTIINNKAIDLTVRVFTASTPTGTISKCAIVDYCDYHALITSYDDVISAISKSAMLAMDCGQFDEVVKVLSDLY